MSRRTIAVDSYVWKVYPAGRITVYGKDEFGLLFELGTGPERKRRCRFLVRRFFQVGRRTDLKRRAP